MLAIQRRKTKRLRVSLTYTRHREQRLSQFLSRRSELGVPAVKADCTALGFSSNYGAQCHSIKLPMHQAAWLTSRRVAALITATRGARCKGRTGRTQVAAR